jgi:hypothetical protein
LDRHWINWTLGNVIAAPWWPISFKFPHHFWETSARDGRWLYLLIPVVLFSYWITFRKERNLLVLMASVLALGFVFADVVYKGNVRNWGIAYIAFVCGLWIKSAQRRSAGDASITWPAPAYGLLGLSVLAGVFALVGSWSHPFSRARDAAMWLRKNSPAGSPLMGLPDVSFASVAEETQQPVYFIECNCIDTFKLFSRDRETVLENQIPARVNKAMSVLHTQQVTFILYRPLQQGDLERLEEAHLQTELLASFSGADVDTENFYIYRISAVPAASHG